MRTIIGIIVALALFCQCDSRTGLEGYGQQYPMDQESFAAIDSCMAYMETDPARAHSMLDSVFNAGAMSPQRCEYLHAMVVYTGEGKCDIALMMCNRLLDKGSFGDDQFLEAEICSLASNILIELNRYVEVVKYANRGIALCHGNEQMRSDEATMMGRVGIARQMLGQFDEARESYDRALDLIREDTSFGGLIALISLQKKQADLFCHTGDYDRMIDKCHEILRLVGRFDRDPSFVNPRPATMTESNEVTHGFADFYLCQVLPRIASAYRIKVEQGVSTDPKADRDSAAVYVEMWLHTDASRSPFNKLCALPELYFTGRQAEFDAAKYEVGESFGSDTLVLEYIEYLTLMAQDAASRHDLTESNRYLQRALVVNDSIHRQDMQRSLSEQVSIHMVQEAQLAQHDAEHQLAQNKMYVALLVTILLTVVAINILVKKNHRHKKIIEAVQQDLQESKHEITDLEQQLEEVKAERTQTNAQTLFQRIEQVMTDKKLYLNPDLDIKTLAKEVGSGTTTLSLCINGITGKSFRIWLSEYRLALFVQMLEQHPDESIDELMARCGYREQSTFRRHFKAAYGVTVSEYKRQKDSQLEQSANGSLEEN